MRVLLAEDDPISLKMMERTLAKWDYEVFSARNGDEAWELINRERLRLVIADWMMPNTDGVTLCRKIRETNLGHYVYFILQTARSRIENVIEGIAAGADDYLTKPLQLEELRVRLKADERILQLEDELVETHDRLLVAATTDGLTGLYNRRTVLDHLSREMARCFREGSSLCVMLIDIDHFKEVNDQFGHGVGDRLLTQTAARIRRACRPYDLPGRYGGDEFLLVTPGAGIGEALRLAERTRSRIADTPLVCADVTQIVTCSIGVAEVQSGETLDALIERADGAAYEAKASGRNRVCAAPTASMDSRDLKCVNH